MSFEFPALSCHENRKFHSSTWFHFSFLKEFRRMFDFLPNVLNELDIFTFLAREKQKKKPKKKKAFEFASLSCHENKKFSLGFHRGFI